LNNNSLPLISTIIPVYNREEMLVRAVESVLAQDYRSIEIIIVNDGSTDNTAKVASRLADSHPESIYVLHIENSGPGKAREAGRAVAKGDFIQYLDSDDWLLPNKFSDQVDALKKSPDADIVYGITQLVNTNGSVLKESSKDTGIERTSLFPALLVDRWWHTSTPIYSKRISDLAGEWPDKRPEDWDLEARMGAHKPILAYVDKVVSCHLEHDSPGRISRGDYKAYLIDEAWFLPRLFVSAVQAGVKKNAAEMDHFSRWAFMRSRHLGAIGESKLAKQTFSLSLEATIKPSRYQFLAKVLAPIIGWKLLGKLAAVMERKP